MAFSVGLIWERRMPTCAAAGMAILATPILATINSATSLIPVKPDFMARSRQLARRRQDTPSRPRDKLHHLAGGERALFRRRLQLGAQLRQLDRLLQLTDGEVPLHFGDSFGGVSKARAVARNDQDPCAAALADEPLDEL